MSIYGAVYIIGTQLAPCIPDSIDKRVTLIISAFFLGIFMLFVGPASFLGLKESFTMLVAGLFLTAPFMPTLVVLALPEMLDAISTRGDIGIESKEIAGNYAGALLSTSMGIGQILGPLYGATCYANFGFAVTQDIVALICIVLASAYFFFAEGLKAFKKTCRRRENKTSPRDQEKGLIDDVTSQSVKTI